MPHPPSLSAHLLGIAWKDYLSGWLPLPTSPVLGLTPVEWIGLGVLACAAIVVGAIAQWIVLRVVHFIARRSSTEWDDRMAALLPGPLGLLLGLLAFGIASPHLDLPPEPAANVEIVVRTLLIIAVTTLLLRFLTLGAQGLEAYLTRHVEDECRRRAIHTQVSIPGGILRVVIVVVGIALILLQFDFVRSVGVSLLASAGLAGIIVGFAAQKVVANLLAGLQLAIFQPLKIGDAVVVEGEWGWVEEIGMTHVVIKIWDERRLVLPVSYFLERPFQNWTHGGSELLGTVFVHADYTISVEALRAELAAILKETPLWDGRAQGVQVTNLTPEVVEIRVLVSARDGGKLWDLRCLVREKLLAWLQTAGGGHLPLRRVTLLPPDAGERPQIRT